MPIKLQLEAPDFKYLFFIDESEEGRCTIIMITGICSMEECVTFISKYPTSFIPPEKKNHMIPKSEEHFQHAVTVQVRGISTAEAGQKMPKWVEYLVEQFSGTVQFTDAYTFHVARHFVRAHTGENLKDSQ